MAVKTVEITEIYKMPDLVSKVLKGVAMLDKKIGPDWDKKVNTDTLDLGHGQTCVVGQLAIKAVLNGPLEGYGSGIMKLTGESNSDTPKVEKFAQDHGFYLTEKYVQEVSQWLEKQPPTHPWWSFLQGPQTGVDYLYPGALRNVLYDYLTALWLAILKERRSQRRKLTEAKRAAKKATSAPAKTAAKKATPRKQAR